MTIKGKEVTWDMAVAIGSIDMRKGIVLTDEDNDGFVLVAEIAYTLGSGWRYYRKMQPVFRCSVNDLNVAC